MRLATLQKKRTGRNKLSRQHAGFGEQHARAPLIGSKVNSVFRLDSRLHPERDHSGRSGWHVASRLFCVPVSSIEI